MGAVSRTLVVYNLGLVDVLLAPALHSPFVLQFLLQTVPVTSIGKDLLSSAYRLTSGRDTWIGGLRDASNPPHFGWSWEDGTLAANLNCGCVRLSGIHLRSFPCTVEG
jgi:hypothetical protein